MKKSILAIAAFMFVLGSSVTAFAQEPEKKNQPATEQTEGQKECKEDTKKEDAKSTTEKAESEKTTETVE